MKTYERLAEALTPDGTLLELYRHDREYIIRADGAELMSTRRHNSEERLAELVCEPLSDQSRPTVLIGGLGFGFTLRAALRLLPADARVIVAEIMAAVVDWNTRPEYPLAGTALRDPRVELRHQDVAEVLHSHAGMFDAIMLDVDNGADALSTAGNAQLYRDEGIRMTVAALRPSGRLAYWSADKDRRFEATLRRAGLSVDAARVQAHATTGRWHTIYVTRRARVSTSDAPA